MGFNSYLWLLLFSGWVLFVIFFACFLFTLARLEYYKYILAQCDYELRTAHLCKVCYDDPKLKKECQSGNLCPYYQGEDKGNELP